MKLCALLVSAVGLLAASATTDGLKMADGNYVRQSGEDKGTKIGASVKGMKLRVSENGRYFVDQDGKPFFYLGDTVWLSFQRMNRAEVKEYLQERAAKRFTVIQAYVLRGLVEKHPDGRTSLFGAPPLIDRDPNEPNEAFFRVKWASCAGCSSCVPGISSSRTRQFSFRIKGRGTIMSRLPGPETAASSSPICRAATPLAFAWTRFPEATSCAGGLTREEGLGATSASIPIRECASLSRRRRAIRMTGPSSWKMPDRTSHWSQSKQVPSHTNRERVAGLFAAPAIYFLELTLTSQSIDRRNQMT